MIPIETVLDLLMANMDSVEDEGGLCFWVSIDDDGGVIQSTTFEGLIEEIRTYLESLVPAPKLLSECEERVEYLMVEKPRIVCREFIYAVDVGLQQRIARADQVQVIQPVEVNRE